MLLTTLRYCLLILLAGAGSVMGQNLVPNPGFEDIKKPQCDFTRQNENVSEYIVDWYAPTAGTPDIWSAAGILPQNCQQRLDQVEPQPRTGSKCLGVYTYVARTGSYREYIQVKLKQPLKQGATYYAEMYVLLLDRSPGGTSTEVTSNTASNNLGLFFSVNPVGIRTGPVNFGYVLTGTPQINRTELVRDTRQWVKVSACFVAEAAYSYLTIGNFFADAQTRLQVVTADLPRNAAYYLIDDVSVTEVFDRIPVADLGADTTLCAGQSVALDLPDSVNTAFRWQDGTTRARYLIRQTGVYSVTATRGICSVSDSLRVEVEPAISLPADTVLCQGEQLVLRANHPLDAYLWSTGSTSSQLSVTTKGEYVLTIPSRYCLITDTIRVDVVDCPGPIPNVFTPNGDGRNETFYIDNIQFLPWRLSVYNRSGQRVYQTEAYTNDWDGANLPTGLYYYRLQNTRLRRELKGWVELMR
ncbi:hypothetical protein GCM10023189_18110 [Nibrella saemangeumensis]|uniref:Gliding motility-associated C-terminal domain-containing protein n=1 Tax=Nibrella saemangeumensis TaxID=1084526 RepID=A0ABP8MRJ3_9BACT